MGETPQEVSFLKTHSHPWIPAASPLVGHGDGCVCEGGSSPVPEPCPKDSASIMHSRSSSTVSETTAFPSEEKVV